MKYVSPKTEQKKQQRKRRNRKLAMTACIVALVAAVCVLAVVFLGDINSHLPSQSASSSVQSEDITSSDIPSVDTTPQPSVTKPSKKGGSIIKKIKGLFSKTELMAVTYPATSFGRQFEEEADEIVSLSPLATEIVLSSPSQDALVAVSEYCDKRGNQLMTVGTPLIPQVDKIIQLAPDVLIVQNPLSEQDRIAMEQSGIVVLNISAPKNITELKEAYRSITALTQGADRATHYSEKFAADLEGKLQMYTASMEYVNKQRAVMLFNSYGMVATSDTFEGSTMEIFFDNAVTGKGYFADGLDSVIGANPQVIITSDLITYEQLAALGFESTDAYINGQIYYVNIQEFENASPKSFKTLMGIANSVYGSGIKPVPTPTPEK
ncbi:MAG: ABC transporter substrate-binding protein [Oscillospiraceae bacterium]|nr:ABC transporter substrate-binding protein [Oscillospiraceae bacterium]